MNLSLKPNPLIALWVPGMALLIAIFLFSPSYYNLISNQNISLSVGTVTIIMIAGSILGFIIGEVLDSIRDLLEGYCYDKICHATHEINWDFFYNGTKDEVENLEEWYFTYYELDSNLYIGIIVLFVLGCCGLISIPNIFIVLLSLVFIILFWDSMILRGEIKKHTHSKKKTDII
jgi:hypothetical protein